MKTKARGAAVSNSSYWRSIIIRLNATFKKYSSTVRTFALSLVLLLNITQVMASNEQLLPINISALIDAKNQSEFEFNFSSDTPRLMKIVAQGTLLDIQLELYENGVIVQGSSRWRTSELAETLVYEFAPNRDYQIKVLLIKRLGNLNQFRLSTETLSGNDLQLSELLLSQAHYQCTYEATKESRNKGLSSLKKSFPTLDVQSPARFKIEMAVQMAYCYRRLKDIEHAQEFYTHASNIAEENGLLHEQQLIINSLASMLDGRGKFAQSRKLYQQALDIAKPLSMPHRSGVTYNNIGLSYHRQGRFTLAEQNYLKAIEYFKQAGYQSGLINTYTNLGGLNANWGEPQKSRFYFKQTLDAITVFETTYNTTYAKKPATGRNVAESEMKQGNFQAAQTLALEALELSKENHNEPLTANILRTLGSIFVSQGEYRLSQRYLEQSIEISSSMQRPRMLIDLYVVLGKQYQDTQQIRLSIETYEKAMLLAKNINNGYLQDLLTLKIGELQLVEQENIPSLEAINAIESKSYPKLDASKHLILGLIHQFNRDIEPALDELNQALTLFSQQKDDEQQAKAFYLLSQTEMMRENTDAALQFIDKAIALIEVFQSKIFQLELKATHLAKYQHFYDLRVAILAKQLQGKPSEQAQLTWQAQEAGLARSFNILVKSKQTQFDDHELQQLLELRTRIAAKYDALQRTKFLVSKKKQIDLLSAELQQLNLKLDLTLGNLRQKYEAEVNTLDISTLTDIQQNLNDSSLILQFQLNGDEVYFWQISKQDVSLRTLASGKQLNERARVLYEQLKLSPSRRARSISRELADMGESLLGQVEGIENYHELIIVAGDNFQFLPFESFYVKSTQGQFTPILAASRSVSYAPSATAWLNLQRSARDKLDSDSSIAIFADPVFESNDSRINIDQIFQQQAGVSEPVFISNAETPRIANRSNKYDTFERLLYSRTEALAITDIALEQEVKHKLIVDFDANKANLINSDWRDYSVLHFATHGAVDELYPRQSGLIFSQWDKEQRKTDAFLSIQDLSSMQMSPNLVVLSACETGVGRQIDGEGLMSLSRAFFAKGSQQVIASLWPVQDNATAELMRNFYKELLNPENEQSASKALVAAKLRLAESRRWRDPYYWSGFVLQGASR